MHLRRADPRLQICDAFLAAASAAGLPLRADLNAPALKGLGGHELNIRRGLRPSTARAHLAPALSRPSPTLPTGAEAARLRIDRRRATGVEIRRDGRAEVLRADREVVLRCGGIMSPTLLLRSGIGPADAPRALGIAVVADAPHVRRDLRNHPACRPRRACSAPVAARRHATPAGAARAALDRLLFRRGALAQSFASVGGFFRSAPAVERADMQAAFLSALPAGGAAGILGLLPREHAFGLTVRRGTPFSRGRASLREADPPRRRGSRRAVSPIPATCRSSAPGSSACARRCAGRRSRA